MTPEEYARMMGLAPAGSQPKQSDESIIRDNLNRNAKDFRVRPDRSIEFRDRRGNLKIVERGTKGYDAAREQLKPAQMAELNRLNEQVAIDDRRIGVEAAAREFLSPPLPESPPEEIFPEELARMPVRRQDPINTRFGESLTDLGVMQQRQDERSEARQQQSQINERTAELLPLIKIAEDELRESQESKRLFDSGLGNRQDSINATELVRRENRLRDLQNELRQTRSGVLLEEQVEDPSRALDELLKNIDATENSLRENDFQRQQIRKRINLLEKQKADRTFSGPLGRAIYGPLGAVVRGITPGVPVLGPEDTEIRQLEQQLSSLYDGLFQNVFALNQMNNQASTIRSLEPLPLSEREVEDLEGKPRFEMRDFSKPMEQERSRVVPNIEGDPFASGLPIPPRLTPDAVTTFQDTLQPDPTEMQSSLLTEEEIAGARAAGMTQENLLKLPSGKIVPSEIQPKSDDEILQSSMIPDAFQRFGTEEVDASAERLERDTGMFGSPGRRF